MVDGKIAVDVLADADGPLLSVKQLIIAVIAPCPIHDIQGELLCNGSDDLVALLVFVDELALEGGADIQLAAVPHNATYPATTSRTGISCSSILICSYLLSAN